MNAKENKFLQWLSSETATSWWHDSANIEEIDQGIANGAVGITTNPVLISNTLSDLNSGIWQNVLQDIPAGLDPEEKTEAVIRKISNFISSKFISIYEQTDKQHGYVCAQVNPKFPGDIGKMLPMARRLAKWAPNISVKLPVTAAGLDVLEECAAEGINITATVSFTVPQVIAVAERYRKGLKRAEKAGITPGKCNAVIMVGRIDDYLRDVAHDSKAKISESDIRSAGIAIIKNAYRIFKERQYEAILMPAGMRGDYHASAFAGADMILSIHPKIQAMLMELNEPFEEKINEEVDIEIIKRLKALREFNKAYEADGMKVEEFITYGVVQKTLSQFVVAGWNPVGEYATAMLPESEKGINY